MIDSELVRRFAALTVRVGVNVQPEQGVFVNANIAHLEIARAVVDSAYGAGAAWVEVEWSDGPMRRSRLTHASIESLRASRPWALNRIASWGEQHVASISLSGDPDPHLFAGIDPMKLAAFPVEEALARRHSLLGSQRRWTEVAAPNVGWATEIFGEPDMDRLWHAVAIAMRLNEPDPVGQWRDRAAQLGARAQILNALALDEVHFRADGTDLTVGLIPDHIWTGGGLTDPFGHAYMPNIPTEEVFTSPDRRRADGTIRLTRPVVIQGQLVDGLTITFSQGQIIDMHALVGEEVAKAHLATDRGARSLGEIALVDRDSRVARTGVVFHNTLFDENAGCHVALGHCLPFAVKDGLSKNAEERYEIGLNASAIHTDVVIGGRGMTVTGIGAGGAVEIIRDDEWVLPPRL